ncbi:MAG: ABC transporter ATP-binding protein, partial [Sulfuricellaceae bacterium]|nr:ABC transporter ATP-binding protein [Sulfuricellaceae bacterium]
MIGETVISVKGLSKCYHIYEKPRDRLLQNLWRGRKQLYKEFWALRDVSFEVRKGAALGIIGRNGCGKSTLLQILTGIMAPTTGTVEVNGKVAALLELGSGFNPEFSGRENVYINGTILGVDREQIDAYWDEIVEFAEIGDFVDQPVKEYSSGMMLRLAFSVQTAFAPEILIVDEALSVGDFFFQQKCLRRIRQLREQGTTLLFVSHDMAVVRDLCEQAIYLRHGEVVYVGASSEAIWRYFQEDSHPVLPEVGMHFPVTDIGGDFQEFRKIAYWTSDDKVGEETSLARILGISLLDKNNAPVLKVKMGEELTFLVLFQAYRDVAYDVGIEIKNRYDQIVTSNNSYTYG